MSYWFIYFVWNEIAQFRVWVWDVCLDPASGDIEVTVDFLTEIDKLVQLIESPIFTCKYMEWSLAYTTRKTSNISHTLVV